MELEYLEKKIKKNLVKKNFRKWNKKSIHFLVSIYENEKYKEFYDFNLILLDDYIIWYKKNSYINDQYSLDKLIDLYCLISNNVYKNIYTNYIPFLEDRELTKKDSFWDIYFFAIFAIILLIIKCFSNLLLNKKIEEKKQLLELQIPIPEDILKNPLIKYFLGNIII